jgi:hypothetical protein
MMELLDQVSNDQLLKGARSGIQLWILDLTN